MIGIARPHKPRLQRGSVSIEYVMISAILVIALGLSFGPDSLLAQVVNAMGLAWRKFVFTMSIPF